MDKGFEYKFVSAVGAELLMDSQLLLFDSS